MGGGRKGPDQPPVFFALTTPLRTWRTLLDRGIRPSACRSAHNGDLAFVFAHITVGREKSLSSLLLILLTSLSSLLVSRFCKLQFWLHLVIFAVV